MALVTSPSGVKAIQKHEGLVLETYVDAVGVPTIGYGHTGSKHAFPNNKITKAKATELLKQDLKDAENAIHKYVNVDLSQEQFDALVSLVFNIGVGNFAKSTLLKKLNRGDYLGAADEFPKWRKGGGRVLPGLVTRRAEERALFLRGTDLQETDDAFESNIEPDSPKSSVRLSEPGVVGTASLLGVGGLSEVTQALEPFAEYSEYVRYVWVALGVLTVLFVLYKSRKED